MLLLLQHAIWPLLILAQPASPAFDVVSVKSASPNRPGGRIVVGMTGREGGPGTSDPARVHYSVICLRFIVLEAFGHPRDLRLSGPSWMDDDWFQVDATMPPTTTESQFREMMQNLLTERFKMQYHRDTKEVTSYSLVVGRSGAKMQASAELPAGQQPPRQRIQAGDDRVHLGLQQATMEKLAGMLASQLDSPVTDDTGLTAKYDFTLNFSKGAAPIAAGAEPLPDVFTALQSQLGLKLEAKKGQKASVPILVIDHIERTPTGN